MPTATDVRSTKPSLPTVENLHDCYTLFFRHGLNPHCVKGFHCPGGLKVATQRAMEHCEIMGYRYIFVRPLIVDIEAEEKFHQGRG